MANWLRINDPIIRSSFQEIYEMIQSSERTVSIALSNALSSINSISTYDFKQLQEDLLKGVSVVFKDISKFDETFPSAIAIGNITLNSDGTVAYGSKGVAITKNGIAGFDDSYLGPGDLPSFTLDTNGNLYLRGEVHAVSGSFAGELKAPSGTLGTITTGYLKNADGSNFIDLGASGAAKFIGINNYDYLTADGKFSLGLGSFKWDGAKLSFVSEDDTPNLITNPDFNVDASCWVATRLTTPAVIETSLAPNPENPPRYKCAKVKNTSSAYRGYAYCGRYTASPGEFFTGTLYAVGDVNIDYNCYAFIAFYDANDTYISEVRSQASIPQTWTKFVVVAEAPANTAYVRFFFAADPNANNTDAYYYFTAAKLKRTRFGDDRVEIGSGDISFYKTGDPTPYKTLRKIEAGTAANGSYVTLSGFYDRPPYIIVSPYDIMTFNSSYTNYNQSLNCYIKDLTGSTTTGEWTFKAEASLRQTSGTVSNSGGLNGYICAGGDSSTGIYNCDAGEGNSISAGNNYCYSASYSLPANTLTVDISATVKHGYWAGFSYISRGTRAMNYDLYYKIQGYNGSSWVDLTGYLSLGYFSAYAGVRYASFSYSGLSVSGYSSVRIVYRLYHRNTNCADSFETDCSRLVGYDAYGYGISEGWTLNTTSSTITSYLSDATVIDTNGVLNWIAIG